MMEDIENALIQRVHLLESFENTPTAKYIAQETLQKYTGLAADLELKCIKDQLEDAAFRILHPVERNQIITEVDSTFNIPGQDTLLLIQENLRKTLCSNGIHDFEIIGRQKTPFSIWQKLRRKNLHINDIRDILGFRVIVNNISECYEALQILHDIFSIVIGGFKDYILYPKDTFYQSLHTSIIGPYQKRIEIQIRTKEMDTCIKKVYNNYWRQKTSFE